MNSSSLNEGFGPGVEEEWCLLLVKLWREAWSTASPPGPIGVEEFRDGDELV